MTWRVERHAGTAAELHHRPWPEPLVRTVWLLEVTRPAIVVGSAQRDDVVAPAGVDVVRRRSGGGAVWLAPGGTRWVDVFVPRADPLWDDDVARGAAWLGAAWVDALRGVGIDEAVAHAGPMRRNEWSATVCFAGLAAGEVTRGAGGSKLVGVSQRRTRHGVRFQCVAYQAWEPGVLARSLRVPVAAVAAVGAGVGDGVAALEAAFVAAMPA